MPLPGVNILPRHWQLFPNALSQTKKLFPKNTPPQRGRVLFYTLSAPIVSRHSQRKATWKGMRVHTAVTKQSILLIFYFSPLIATRQFGQTNGSSTVWIAQNPVRNLMPSSVAIFSECLVTTKNISLWQVWEFFPTPWWQGSHPHWQHLQLAKPAFGGRAFPCWNSSQAGNFSLAFP